METSKQKSILREWIQQYKGLVFQVIRAYAFTESDRDDLFQEITIQVWKSIPNFKEKSAVSTWVYRISLNTALTWKRKEKKHDAVNQKIEEVQHLILENKIDEDDRLTWLYEEIGKLNEIDRSVTLLMLDGYSYKEMAKMLGISEGNVGVKINRIKKHLTIRSAKYERDGI